MYEMQKISWFDRNPKKTIFFSLAGFFVLLVLSFEIYGYMRYEGIPIDIYYENEMLETPPWAGFKDKNILKRSRLYKNGTGECETTSKFGVVFFDYFIYGNDKICQEKYSFKGRKEYGQRNTINPYELNESDYVIWIFGGSTLQNSGSTDEYTIASLLSKLLNQTLEKKIYVINHGVGGFQSTLERIKYFELLKREERKPNLVIFYDGYNDASQTYSSGPGVMEKHLSEKLRMVVERKYLRMIGHIIRESLSEYSYTFQFGLKIAKGVYHGRKQELIELDAYESKTMRTKIVRGIQNYILNQSMIRAISKELGIKVIFFWQPMIFTKEKLGPFEKEIYENRLNKNWLRFCREFYKEIKSSQYTKGIPDFCDIRDLFGGDSRDYYKDYGHVSPFGNIRIAKTMNDILISNGIIDQKN